MEKLREYEKSCENCYTECDGVAPCIRCKYSDMTDGFELYDYWTEKSNSIGER